MIDWRCMVQFYLLKNRKRKECRKNLQYEVRTVKLLWKTTSANLSPVPYYFFFFPVTTCITVPHRIGHKPLVNWLDRCHAGILIVRLMDLGDNRNRAQGSPPSPVFFNVYTASVARLLTVGVGRNLTCADDLLIYKQGHRSEMARDMPTSLDHLSNWCSN